MAERSRSRRGRADRGRSTRPGGQRRVQAPTTRPEVLPDELDIVVDDEVEAPAPEPDVDSDVEGENAPVRATPRRVAAPIAHAAAEHLRGINPRHAVILAVVIGFVTLTLAMPVRTYFSQRAEFDQLRESNAQLRKEVADYQQKVNEQGDPAYTEAKARSRLQYARPGETVLVLSFPGEQARKAAAERDAARARNPWYGNLWDSISTPVTK